MKKRVTFAKSFHQAEASLSSTGMNESNTELKKTSVNFNNTLNTYRSPAALNEPKIQDVTTIPVPATITAGPFLKHAALSPAQKEYLYTVVASYSRAHVRSLITQHYMNVLQRRIRPGYRDELEASATSLESEKHHLKSQSDVSSGPKHKTKTSTNPQHDGKSLLPNGQARFSSSSTSKRRKIKNKHLPK